MVFFVLPVHAQSFFERLPDIPLMDGLVEIEDRAFSFDKPEGRILKAYAQVDAGVDAQSLISYYAQVLPEFGWKATSSLSYQRVDENLNMILIKKADGRHVLEITISP